MDGAAGIYEELAAEIGNFDLTAIDFRMATKAASEESMMSNIMKVVGDFAKSETTPAGAEPLTYDIYRMTQIGVTAIEAAPKMMTTMKSDLGPLLEKFGMEATGSFSLFQTKFSSFCRNNNDAGRNQGRRREIIREWNVSWTFKVE